MVLYSVSNGPKRYISCLPSLLLLNLNFFTVIWFQNDPDRENAYREYRGDTADEDNVARHVDSIGKWIILLVHFYRRLCSMHKHV